MQYFYKIHRKNSAREYVFKALVRSHSSIFRPVVQQCQSSPTSYCPLDCPKTNSSNLKDVKKIPKELHKVLSSKSDQTDYRMKTEFFCAFCFA
jgi:hypothetical protein